eukprot:403355840
MKPSSLRSQSVVESVRSASERHQSVTSLEKPDADSTIIQPMTGEEKRLIVIILISVCFTWTLYGNISTFYPPFRLEHHKSISDTQVGIVLAMFEGGVLITSPLIGMSLSNVGRKNYIIIGYISCIIASTGFGLLVYIENDITFFIVSIFLRILQGFGDACVSNACLSLVSSEFPTRREQFYGYTESALGTGLMLGPVIGQALYTALDFEYTFYCTTGILCMPLILVIFLIPNKMNRSDEDRADSMTSSQRLQNQKKITLKMLLKNKRVMMASISSIFAMIFMLFYDTILSDQLIEVGLDKNLVGYLFALICLVYTLCSPIVGHFSQKIKKIYITQAAFIFASISLFFFGPSKLLHFPDSLTFMIIGMVLLGFSCSLIFVPLLPEIIDAVQDKENIGENNELNDKASSLFNMSYAIGCLIAPILGGAFNDSYKYRTTCDIFAVSAATFAVIYFFINLLPNIIESRQKKVYKAKYQGIVKKDKLSMNFYDSSAMIIYESEKWGFMAKSKLTGGDTSMGADGTALPPQLVGMNSSNLLVKSFDLKDKEAGSPVNNYHKKFYNHQFSYSNHVCSKISEDITSDDSIDIKAKYQNTK